MTKNDGVADRHYLGNLRWTESGAVWASWHLDPVGLPTTRTTAAAARAVHTALFRALSGHEVLLTGHLAWTDPSEVVDQMLQDVTPGCQSWLAEVDQTIDMLPDLGFVTRRWALHVRLNVAFKQAMRTWLRTAANTIAAQANIIPISPTDSEITDYTAASDAIAARLPAVFNPRPLSEAELIWQRRHAQSRSEISDPTLGSDHLEQLHLPSGRAAVGEPILDPGGISDLAATKDSALRRLEAPFKRRWLKVTTDTAQTSWQAAAVLSNLPKGMGFPEYAFLATVDNPGVPVDVAIRAQVRPRLEALSLNARSLRQLNDQLDQVDDAEIQHAASQLRLYDAAEVLSSYHAEMQREDREVEVAPIIMVSASSLTDGADADRSITDFIDAPQYRRFTWARPVGAQDRLFWAMQPGQPVAAQLRDYQHITTSNAFAATAPVTSQRIGDDHGMLLAENTATRLRSPVYLDLFGNVDKHKSCSIGILGEQGAGKTFTQMKICGATVDRGGRMIATDITPEGEWMRFARSLGCDAAIVDLSDPAQSIDPLRVLPPKVAGTVVKSFLVTLLNIGATDPKGRTIAKIVNPRYLVEHQIGSMGQMQRHLGSDCSLPGARELADRIEVFADPDISSSLAAAVFDPHLEPIDLEARAIVVGTSNVSQPSNSELELAHRFKTLGPEKIFGRAIYALIARLAMEVCHRDRSEDAIFNIDEFHHFRSPEALESCIQIARVGRHHRGGLCVGTHDPRDLTSDVFKGLLKNRLVMRCDPKIAEEFAKFVGYSPDRDQEAYEAAVEQIQSLPAEPGHGLYRDRVGMVGPIRILRPATEARYQAILSTPPSKART